jgi:hypothetical protein
VQLELLVHKGLPELMVLLVQLVQLVLPAQLVLLVHKVLLVLLVHRVLLDLPEQRMQQISQVSWQ